MPCIVARSVAASDMKTVGTSSCCHARERPVNGLYHFLKLTLAQARLRPIDDGINALGDCVRQYGLGIVFQLAHKPHRHAGWQALACIMAAQELVHCRIRRNSFN